MTSTNAYHLLDNRQNMVENKVYATHLVNQAKQQRRQNDHVSNLFQGELDRSKSIGPIDNRASMLSERLSGLATSHREEGSALEKGALPANAAARWISTASGKRPATGPAGQSFDFKSKQGTEINFAQRGYESNLNEKGENTPRSQLYSK